MSNFRGAVLLLVVGAAMSAVPIEGHELRVPVGTHAVVQAGNQPAAVPLSHYQWPVDVVSVSQVYACRRCLCEPGTPGCTTDPEGRYGHGINMHTGVDLAGARRSTIRAAADGDVVKVVGYDPGGVGTIYLWNDANDNGVFDTGEEEPPLVTGGTESNHGLGITVIIQHYDGTVSLYGHLDAVRKDIYQAVVGRGETFPVYQGDPIALMGFTESSTRGSTNIHVHFELKTEPVLGNSGDDGPYWGYVPGHPDLYGYVDPREYVDHVEVETISPLPVRNPPPGSLNVRSSPGVTFFGTRATAVIEQLAEDQEYVAVRKAVDGGRLWYFVYLPSSNPDHPADPTNGPAGGWIADEAIPDATAEMVLVNQDGVRVRSEPNTAASILGNVYEQELFVTTGTPTAGSGCSVSWRKIFLPGDRSIPLSGPTAGWVCGQYLLAPPAGGNRVLTVDSTGDDPDSDTNDGQCNDGSEACTLRAAIEEANAVLGLDVIAFSIPGPGVHTIRPASVLPTINDPVIIDGYTQPGAQPTALSAGFDAVILVELDGTPLEPGNDGLTITGGGSLVRGLAIGGFQGVPEGDEGVVGGGAIKILGAGSNQVQGNCLGTDATGSVARSNSFGVAVGEHGFFGVGASNNLIGGTRPGARNVISGNDYSGIAITSGSFFSRSQNNRVQGNFLGVTASGEFLGNADAGVLLYDTDFNVVGGTEPGAGNVAKSHAHGGVAVQAGGLGNTITGNSVSSNGGLGIDLVGPDAGVTPNDIDDPDDGPNELQNFPDILAASASTLATRITGSLRSTPLQEFTLEFFGSASCDPSGYGEGEQPLGRATVHSDPSGFAPFSIDLAQSVLPGYSVTATATNVSGSTSEFSACVQTLQDYLFDFGPAATSPEAGYTRDSGASFNGQFGWITPPAPGQTRNRIGCSASEKQRTFIFSTPRRVWELAVPPGAYAVTASVGECSYASGPHRVEVEGVALIDGDPMPAGQFSVRSAPVWVADGRLTVAIGNGSANTMLNSLEVRPVLAGPAVGRTVNFQPCASVTPVGFERDCGERYAAGRGSGWDRDLRTSTRERNVQTDQVLDTFLFVTSAPTFYRMNLANGVYDVEVGVGDPSYAGGPHRVIVEGVPFFETETTARNDFKKRRVRIAVVDGRLDVEVGGSTGTTSVDYLSVREVIQTPLRVNFQPQASEIPAGYVGDWGSSFDAGRGLGWSTSLDGRTRERQANSDQRLDTLLYVGAPAATWEAALTPGEYEVTVTVGDASYAQGPHFVTMEGVPLFTGASTPAGSHLQRTARVQLIDGLLTLRVGGGTTGLTTIDFVDIVPLPIFGTQQCPSP